MAAPVTIWKWGGHSDQFRVTFNGTDEIITTSTSSGAEADSWICETLTLHRAHLPNLIVGFDAEWLPSFNSDQNPVAVIQLCVDRRCLVFHIIHSDRVPASLYDFFADERFTFVGVGVDDDAARICYDYDLRVSRTVDLRQLAAERTGRRELKQKGLAGLAMEIMGVDISKSKSVTMSRWDQAFLTYDQLKYACVDAFLSFEIGRRLFQWDF